MADFAYDTIDRFTVGALGLPGERTFYLQATYEGKVHSWTIEKGQAVAIAFSAYSLLGQIGEDEMMRDLMNVRSSGAYPKEFEEAMSIVEVEPEFRVDPSTMELAYDADRKKAIISFDEALEEGSASEPKSVRLSVSHRQLAAFGIQALAVAGRGRPICPLCGRVKEEDHRCPPQTSNGHTVKQER